MLIITSVYKLFLILLISINIPLTYSFQATIAPVYKLNLDESASTRWLNIFNDTINKHSWQYSFGPIITFIEKIIPYDTWVKYDDLIVDVMSPIVGKEITSEIVGLMQLIKQYKQNVTMSQMLSFQIFYELLIQCTGIIVRSDNSSVIHGRNLDIPLNVKNITATVIWYKNNTEIIHSTQLLGYMGIHTGMRVNGWSIQANLRKVLVPGPIIGYEKSILMRGIIEFLNGHPPVGNFLRYGLQTYSTYDTALEYLKYNPVASPMYLIIGGHNTGSVITKDWTGLANETSDTSIFGMNSPKPKPVMNMTGKYMVQTNWDPWINKTRIDCINSMKLLNSSELEKCHIYIKIVYGSNKTCFGLCQLYSDCRHDTAVAMLNDIPNNYVNYNQLLQILSTSPVRQLSITQFTAIMSVSQNIYDTWLQDTLPSDTSVADDIHTINLIRFFMKKIKNNKLDDKLCKSCKSLRM